MKILTIILLVLSLGLLGFNVYMGFIFKRPKIVDSKEVVKIEAELPQQKYEELEFDLGNFTINLVNESNEQGQRFVQMTIQLGVLTIKPTEAEALRGNLQDIVIKEISFRKISELDGLQDKIDLKSKLISEFNKVLKDTIVKEVNFNSFTIQ